MKEPQFKFGEWLPDQPDLDNPGVIEARNVLPVSRNYRPYLPMVNTGATLTGAPLAALRGRGNNTVATQGNLYVVTASKIYVATGTVPGTFVDVTPASWAATIASMAQYNELIIAVNGSLPQFTTLQLAGPPAFTTLTGTYGDAPNAAVVGVVGQFVVLGNSNSAAFPSYAIQWSGINAPTDWPAPNSAAAIAAQSGRQLMDSALGSVWGISQGDQWGVVLMDGGLVRMTYTGGSTVFAFDTIYRGPGPLFPGWWLKVGSRVYFASTAGFFMTDGTQVIPIGRDKADQYFLSRLDAGAFTSVQCGVDYINRLIYWTLPKSGDSGAPQEALVYNYEENRWTHVFDTVRVFVRGEESVIAQVGLQVFGNNSRVGTLTGTPGTAIFTTQEIRLNPAGKTLMSGLRPQIEGAVLANIAIKVGYRNNQTDAVTTTGAQTADTFTGAANFLIDARYHRAEFDITGAFTKASGGTFDAQPTSDY